MLGERRETCFREVFPRSPVVSSSEETPMTTPAFFRAAVVEPTNTVLSSPSFTQGSESGFRQDSLGL